MNEFKEIIKIADIHADRIKMALDGLKPLLPFEAKKIQNLRKEELLFADLLVHRFGKLQDILGNKIINEFLVFNAEYETSATMLDKIHKLERLEVIEDAEIWKEMRRVRNHITHEYPDHPEFTAADLNKIAELAPKLLKIFDNIKSRCNISE